MNFRVRATAIHLAASVAVAALAWWLVNVVWYPAPLAEMAGGTALFVILVSVDMVIGPALTAVVANPRKSRPELTRDLGVILALQLAAFGYGMFTMAAARPIAVAFEVDLFRVVSAAQVDEATLHTAPPALRSLSWTGPVTLAAIKPSDPAEQLRTIELALAGTPLAALPEHWREYEGPQAQKAWAAARPVAELLLQHASVGPELDRLAAKAGVTRADLRVLPLLGRRSEGVVLLAGPQGRVVGSIAVTAGP